MHVTTGPKPVDNKIPSKKTCPTCKATNAGDARACVSCGSDLSQVEKEYVGNFVPGKTANKEIKKLGPYTTQVPIGISEVGQMPLEKQDEDNKEKFMENNDDNKKYMTCKDSDHGFDIEDAFESLNGD